MTRIVTNAPTTQESEKRKPETWKITRSPRLRPMRKELQPPKEDLHFLLHPFFSISLFLLLLPSAITIIGLASNLSITTFLILLPFLYTPVCKPRKLLQDDRNTSRRQRGVQVNTPGLAILSDQVEWHCKYCQAKVTRQ